MAGPVEHLVQVGGAILGVGGLLIQGLHDLDHHVDADEVGQLQGAHGQVVAQLAGLVDVLVGADVLPGQDGGLVHHGAHDPVGDEHGHVLHGDELLAKALGHGLAGLNGVLGGVIGVDDLHQLHGGHGAEEVHAQELLRPLRGGSQLRDAQGGGVGHEDGVGLDDGSHLGEGLLFQLHVFDHGLEDNVHVLQIFQGGGGLHPAQPLVGLLLGDLAFGNFFCKVLLDPSHAFFQGGGSVVVEDHVIAALQSDLGDASAHEACAVHAYSFHFHVSATP